MLTTPDTSQGAAIDGSLTRLRADADAIVENLEDGFLMFDAELRLARCNGAAPALIGRSRDVLRGQAMPELMPPPLGLLLEARLQRVLRRHLILIDFLMRAASSHGRWLPEGMARTVQHRRALTQWYHT